MRRRSRGRGVRRSTSGDLAGPNVPQGREGRRVPRRRRARGSGARFATLWQSCAPHCAGHSPRVDAELNGRKAFRGCRETPPQKDRRLLWAFSTCAKKVRRAAVWPVSCCTRQVVGTACGRTWNGAPLGRTKEGDKAERRQEGTRRQNPSDEGRRRGSQTLARSSLARCETRCRSLVERVELPWA